MDVTVGYGGHAQAILERTGPGDHILIDRDPQAVAHIQQQLGGQVRSVVQGDFARELAKLSEEFDMVLADLGVSSPQLDNPDRGFSFDSSQLDMRMDPSQQLTAAEVVNTLPERELADILYRYGEERQSRRIAAAIVARRPLYTARDLAATVAAAYRGQSRIHPATRTFQALRIFVNDELGQLERSLPMIETVLAPGGRVGIISFHSLEDRLVKQFIRSSSLEPMHKSVIQGRIHDVSNRRARSAKLRVARKI